MLAVARQGNITVRRDIKADLIKLSAPVSSPRSVGRSFSRSVGRSISPSVDRFVSRSVGRSVGRLVSQSLVRSIDWSIQPDAVRQSGPIRRSGPVQSGLSTGFVCPSSRRHMTDGASAEFVQTLHDSDTVN